MKKNNFYDTKAGRLTLALIVILLAFVLIMIGLYSNNTMMSAFGFITIVIAMLYSPFKVYLWDRIRQHNSK